MIHKAWCCLGEVPYCFSRSSVKFQGHTWQKITNFDPNWAFPDCNFSLNSTMAMKCCIKLEATYKRCPIVFQCHASNFKVTQNKKSPILTRIECFQTVTPVWIHRWLWNEAHRKGALFFSMSSIKFLGHKGQKKITDFGLNWAFPNSNSSLNSPRGLRWCTKLDVV